MALGFVLSKMQQVLLRLRAVDTLPSRAPRDSDATGLREQRSGRSTPATGSECPSRRGILATEREPAKGRRPKGRAMSIPEAMR